MIENIEIGSLIYYPSVDHGVGFAIEEITVINVVGPSRNPYGYSWLKWSYGNVFNIRERLTKRDGAPTFFLKKDCYLTMQECVDFLEQKRLEMINFQKDKKEQMFQEIVEFRKVLKELQKENLEVSRQSNKNVAMLTKLDIKRDLERKGFLE